VARRAEYSCGGLCAVRACRSDDAAFTGGAHDSALLERSAESGGVVFEMPGRVAE
jgi:hypothetical protein